MNTNGHEWKKKDLTTKNTKNTKEIAGGESKNHEWTRMDTNGKKEGFNHEKHELT